MIYLETTSHISTETLSTLFSRRIQGRVRIQQQNSIYLFHCQRTHEFYRIIAFIQEHGGFPLLVDGQVVVLRHHLLSKL